MARKLSVWGMGAHEILQDLVRYWASSVGRLRLLILPPFSPHPNTEEWAWSWLKRHKLGKALVAGQDQCRTLLDRYLRSL